MRTKDQILDLYTGDLPQELLPDFQFPAFTWEMIRNESLQSTPAGYPPLQEVLMRHLTEDFGIPYLDKTRDHFWLHARYHTAYASFVDFR